jgi:hypothetical protein
MMAVASTGIKGNFEITMGTGITFGVNAGGELSSEQLVGAEYQDRPNGWTASGTCKPPTEPS